MLGGVSGEGVPQGKYYAEYNHILRLSLQRLNDNRFFNYSSVNLTFSVNLQKINCVIQEKLSIYAFRNDCYLRKW